MYDWVCFSSMCGSCFLFNSSSWELIWIQSKRAFVEKPVPLSFFLFPPLCPNKISNHHELGPTILVFVWPCGLSINVTDFEAVQPYIRLRSWFYLLVFSPVFDQGGRMCAVLLFYSSLMSKFEIASISCWVCWPCSPWSFTLFEININNNRHYL